MTRFADFKIKSRERKKKPANMGGKSIDRCIS
jgi:hypothetical protein